VSIRKGVKRTIRQSGLTQKAFAEKLGWQLNQLTRIMTNNTARTDSLEKIAAVQNMSAGQLLILGDMSDEEYEKYVRNS
jgi:transcriptional regulator with XRE-family HTH domain